MNGQTKKWLYLYAGWDIVGVMNESGQLLETYTRGVGLAGDIGTLVAVTHHTGSAVTPGTYYTHCNQRGDVVLTRSGTTTTGTYDYTAFGSLKTQTGTDVCRFKFSSKEREQSCGFSYYGARFYAPQWQRFLNQDPIQENGGINLYRFVGNSPVSRIDPLGLAYGNPVSGPNGPVGPSDPYAPGGVFWKPPVTSKGDPLLEDIMDYALAQENAIMPGGHGDYGGGFSHCVANCLLKRRWGAPPAYVARTTWNYLFERPHYLFDYSDPTSPTDIIANQAGAEAADGPGSCVNECKKKYPPCKTR